ncbi:MAG: hypothetical protein MJE68_25425, partial [Proteobacteria bacterium]|nr:hypothetical protein [Pseudomonadota bacterium]
MNMLTIQEDDANAQLPFLEAPLCAYYGHTADILDLSWSKVREREYTQRSDIHSPPPPPPPPHP